MKTTSRLRKLLAEPGIILAPGAFDAFSARLVAQSGFPAVYMTGSGSAAAIAGATAYLVLQELGMEGTSAAYVGMAAVAGLRLAAIWWRLRLPVFHVRDEEKPR